jgi:hypothetical protein
MPVPSQGHYGFTVFRLLTDFVCLYTYEFWLSLCKIVRSSVILFLPLFTNSSVYVMVVIFPDRGRKSPTFWKSLIRLYRVYPWSTIVVSNLEFLMNVIDFWMFWINPYCCSYIHFIHNPSNLHSLSRKFTILNILAH